MARSKKSEMKLNPKIEVDSGGYPKLLKTNGFWLQLDDTHLAEVERLVGVGASKRYVARSLGCSEGELERALKACPELSVAIEHGVAEDEYVLTTALRDEALSGDVSALGLYLKARHGWRDRDSQKGGGSGAININITGLLEKGVTVEHDGETFQEV